MNETVATYYSFSKLFSLMFFVDEMNVALSYYLCLLNRVGREKVGRGCGGGNVGEGQQRVRERWGGGGGEKTEILRVRVRVGWSHEIKHNQTM